MSCHFRYSLIDIINVSVFEIIFTVYLKWLYFLGQSVIPYTVEDFASEVYSALNKVQSDVKNLSEVHVVIFEHQMTQKFIIAMQKCFETKGAKPKGLLEKITSHIPGFQGRVFPLVITYL